MPTKRVTHVATTDIADMMKPGPERRMNLPGYDREFVDFPHYIIRITEQIWHERQVDLCLRYYASDAAIHTLGGDVIGAQTVVDNTWATLAAFPDRRLDGDNVIWSSEPGSALYSSHLITSKMTNLGASEFGPATSKKVRVLTIADCLCRENKIVEEWLARDNLGLVRQLGFDELAIAERQAQADRDRKFSLIDFHERNRAKVVSATRPAGRNSTKTTVAFGVVQRIFSGIWNERAYADLPSLYDYRVDAMYPGSVRLYGHDEVRGVLGELFTAVPDARVSIDHVAEIPYLGDARDVAVRWSLTGTHMGGGRYGAPSGAAVYILGISHFRVMRGRVREERTVWDDVAVLRQIATARLNPMTKPRAAKSRPPTT